MLFLLMAICYHAHGLQVEEGIRNIAALRGSKQIRNNALATRQSWEDVDIWRKRQCYCFAARHYLKCENYQPYHNFLWKDAVQRERLIKTFNVRHRPLTDGSDSSHFARTFTPAVAGWDDGNPESDGDTRWDAPAAAQPAPTQEWDSDQEEWVPSTTGTTVSQPQQSTLQKRRKQKRKVSKKRRRSAEIAEPAEPAASAAPPDSAAPDPSEEAAPKRRSTHPRTKPRRKRVAVRCSPCKKR